MKTLHYSTRLSNCTILKEKIVFQGTVEQAKEIRGCRHFEDAYLTISKEEIVK